MDINGEILVMSTIILMLDALGDAPEAAVKAAETQGYPCYRYKDDPTPPKLTDPLERIEAIVASRNRSREWILYQPFDFIALVDSDVVLPEGAVTRLQSLALGHGIAGGWVPVRGADGKRWIAGLTGLQGSFANYLEPSKRLCPTDMTPLACCVMSREIFAELPCRAPGKDDMVKCALTGQSLIASEPYLYAIDLYQKRGKKCLMHPDVICQHL